MKKLNTPQIVVIILIIVIGIYALYGIITNLSQTDELTAENVEYPYITSIEGSVIGDSMMGIVHKPEKLDEVQLTHEFHYNLDRKQPVYYIDHPFYGINCSLFQYETELEDTTLVINEMQEGDCDDEKQAFYITTSLIDSRVFSKIRLDEIVNGEVVNSNLFEIDPTVTTR